MKKHHEMPEGHKKEHKGKMEKRADGGMLHDPMDEKERGHQKIRVTRKRGGHVHGEAPKHRLDKRARGGGMNSDKVPFTAAHDVTKEDYVGDQIKGGTEAKGKDMSHLKSRD